MKLRSALNNGFLSLGLGSIFAGLLRAPAGFDFLHILPLVIFFIFFRIKMWLDDAVYFNTTVRKNRWFDLGVLVAITAWCLWAAAGYTISDPGTSYSALMWSVIAMSIWILSDAAHGRAFGKDRKYFIMLNAIYAAILWAMNTESVSLPFPKNNLAWVLVAGTIVDFLFHGSLENFKE